jgi:hypothetical protein
MTMDGLVDLMERHAKSRMLDSYAEYANGKQWYVRAFEIVPYFPDEDTATAEGLEEAEEFRIWLAENPSAAVIIDFKDWFPNQWVCTQYSFTLADANAYGENLGDVMDLHLLNALEELQRLEPPLPDGVGVQE